MSTRLLLAIPLIGVVVAAVGVMLYTGARVDPVVTTSEEGVTITLKKPREGPVFARQYEAVLPGDRRIEITMETNYSYGYRAPDRHSDLSLLRQANGHFVTFDPTRVAEKVLDPLLIEPVKSLSARILAMDAAWWAAKPAEFTDAGGTTWVRK